MADLRPPLDAALGAFSLPAMVTPPGQDTVETEAFWLPPTAAPAPQGGATFQQTERRRVLVVPLYGDLEIPRETVVSLAEFEGGDVLDFKVDSVEVVDHDHFRLLVVPVVET